ncbi:MAG: hypothetical protein U0931_23125 [Vulcanimicrobiota bacterium]
MSTELEDLLTREQKLGTYESTGVFTLSVADARRKLSQFQLGSLELAVLKLIQALVQLEPRAIWIESDERAFVLNWAEPQQSIEPQQLLQNLEQVMLGQPGPDKDLAIGLGGFLDLEPARMWWAHWQDQQIVQLLNLLGGPGQVELAAPVGLYARVCCLRIEAGPRSLALDRATIANRTLFAPLPILWNGRLMCELSWNPPGYVSGNAPYWADFYFSQDSHLSRGLALKPIGGCRTMAQWADQSQKRNFPEQSRGYVSLRRYMVGPPTRPLRFSGRRPKGSPLYEVLSQSPEVSLETFLGESMWIVSGATYAPSVLLCVKHGVLLNPCPLPLSLGGLVVVMAAPDLEVDLSQFTARQKNSQAWANMLEVLNARASLVAETLSRQSGQLFRDNRELVPMMTGAGILGGVAGMLVFPMAGFGFLMAGACSTLSWAYLKGQHEQRLNRLRKVSRR